VFRAPWGRWEAIDPAPSKEAQVTHMRCCGGPLDGICVALHSWDRQPNVPTELALTTHGGRYELVATYQWRPTRTTSSDGQPGRRSNPRR
jgi:hypothetical protein